MKLSIVLTGTEARPCTLLGPSCVCGLGHENTSGAMGRSNQRKADRK